MSTTVPGPDDGDSALDADDAVHDAEEAEADAAAFDDDRPVDLDLGADGTSEPVADPDGRGPALETE